MSGTEYVLLVLVILVPAVLATGVTLWSLEQVRMRSKRYRRRKAAANAATVRPSAADRGRGVESSAVSADDARSDVVAAVSGEAAVVHGVGPQSTKGKDSIGGG